MFNSLKMLLFLCILMNIKYEKSTNTRLSTSSFLGIRLKLVNINRFCLFPRVLYGQYFVPSSVGCVVAGVVNLFKHAGQAFCNIAGCAEAEALGQC